MAMKYDGTFKVLVNQLTRYGVRGKWEPQPNGVFMLRCACCLHGANLHWAQGSKSIWCDGKEQPKAKLVKRIEMMLHDHDREENERAEAACLLGCALLRHARRSH